MLVEVPGQMTKTIRSAFFLMGLAVVLVTALADRSSASPQIVGAIKELWVNDGASSNVAWLLGETTFTSVCGATSAYLLIDLAEPGMKEACALALSAFMAGQNVRMSGYGCYGQYEKLKYIYMVQ